MFKFLSFLSFAISVFALDISEYQYFITKIEPSDTHKSLFFTLNDSSIWETAYENLEELLKFEPNDFFIITINNNWFYQKKSCLKKWIFKESLDFSFRLINPTTHKAINANNLFLPLINHPEARFIHDLDLQKQSLTINNNLVFMLHDKDFPTYKNWTAGDSIIIGQNHKFFTKYRFLLINLNTNNYVRAIPFGRFNDDNN